MRALFALSVIVLEGCRSTVVGGLDAGTPAPTVTLAGRVCTGRPDPAGFPLKVVLLFDQSGSMCITDPPGAQASPGFCEQAASVPPGRTQPARLTALKQVLASLAQRPNVSVALVPFDTNPRGVFPSSPGVRFARPDTAFLTTRVDQLQAELGNLSDLQGALDFAVSLVTADVEALEQTAPESLSRTKYVVLLVTDGPPRPRCAVNDTLTTFADDLHPELVWPDESSWCNTFSPQDPDPVSGFVAGTARNQTVDLRARVARLLELERQHWVGEVQVHTALLSNAGAMTACGPVCADLFGPALRWPGPVSVPVAEVYGFAQTSARWLLRELATAGGGSFTEYADDAGVLEVSFTQLDGPSLAAEDVVKQLFVQPKRAVAWNGAWAVDADGDGLPDDEEAARQTDPLLADTDGDGFDDLFELRRVGDGFDPLVQDARGCNATLPGCVARDVDGDGLSAFAEAWLGTSATLVDSDRDGLPDGVEVRAGLSPLVPVGNTDGDGDGVTDLQEVLRGSAPTVPDRAFSDALGMRVSVAEAVRNADQTICYDFTVSNAPLVETPATQALPAGASLFTVWFGASPRGLLEADPGTWLTACAAARSDGAGLVPASGTRELTNADFRRSSVAYDPSRCVGIDELSP
ncbi:MAG: VWA domain-containing protein [Myxococcota bacterium]